MMVHSELIAALCTALTFACSVQIIITCFLQFPFTKYLTVLNCNWATAAGVLSGLVTVPTVIQLRAASVSSRVGMKYGYTVHYKRLAIGTCAILQTATWVCTVINIYSNYDEDTFLNIMKVYANDQTGKTIVDNIQWFLQCCGAKNYDDWFDLDWGGFLFGAFRRKKSIKELLYGNTDDYPDLVATRSDAVPFSCCSEHAKTACVHQNLEQLGTYTINTVGCTNKIMSTKQSILMTEFFIYTICLVLEITILALLLKTSEVYVDSSVSNKCFHSCGKKEFSEFVNQAPIAIIRKGESA